MRRGSRWWPPAVAVAVVLFAIGFASGRGTGEAEPASEPPMRSALPTDPGDPEPAAPGTGTPEYPRTAEGAVAAATAYALALDGPTLFDEQRRTELLDEIAADAAREELGAVFGQVSDQLAFQFALTPDVLSDEGFVWRAVPAGWQLRSYDGERAIVGIWATGVAVARGRSLVRPGWGTTEVDLVWERGAWRLVGMFTEGGPEPPQLGDEGGGGADAKAMNQFEPFVYLPASVAITVDASA